MVRRREQPRGEEAGAGAEPLGGEGLAERLRRGDRGVDGRVGVAAAREGGGCGEEERGAAAAAEEHSGRIAGWHGLPHTREGTRNASRSRAARPSRSVCWSVEERKEMDLFLRAAAARGCRVGPANPQEFSPSVTSHMLYLRPTSSRVLCRCQAWTHTSCI